MMMMMMMMIVVVVVKRGGGRPCQGSPGSFRVVRRHLTIRLLSLVCHPELRSAGLSPDLIMCRSSEPVAEATRQVRQHHGSDQDDGDDDDEEEEEEGDKEKNDEMMVVLLQLGLPVVSRCVADWNLRP
jgi:hypothetical protein